MNCLLTMLMRQQQTRRTRELETSAGRPLHTSLRWAFRGAGTSDFTITKQQKSNVSERVGLGRKVAKGIEIQALDTLNNSKTRFL